jgi:hypothetical protein
VHIRVDVSRGSFCRGEGKCLRKHYLEAGGLNVEDGKLHTCRLVHYGKIVPVVEEVGHDDNSSIK